MPCVVAFIAAHACNSLALSSTLKLENVLRSSSLVLALALRSPIVCLSILMLETCLAFIIVLLATALHSSFLIVAHARKRLALIHAQAKDHLALNDAHSQSAYPHIYACSSGCRKRPRRCAFALCSVEGIKPEGSVQSSERGRRWHMRYTEPSPPSASLE
jgi:hypothetical protein